MPRKPTGRPTGRPLHSGALRLGTADPQTRLTIRLPADLYTRLEAFAEGRSYTRHGTPQMAGCVRALLEHALACPYKRQTESNPTAGGKPNGQTRNVPPESADIWPTTSVPTPVVLDEDDLEAMRVTGQRHPNGEAPERLRPVPPGYYLGAPCRFFSHLSHGTTPGGEPQNLRNPRGQCVLCEEQKQARKAQRQTMGRLR